MTQPVLQRKFLSRWRRWLAITLILGLVGVIVLAFALWRQAIGAEAKDCRGETPLPTGVHLITPGAEVPEAVARFAGAWTGVWRPQGLVAISLLVPQLHARPELCATMSNSGRRGGATERLRSAHFQLCCGSHFGCPAARLFACERTSCQR